MSAQTRFLLAFALLSSFMGTSVGLAKVATSLYALELQAGETMLGLIAGAQSFGILLVSLPIGALVDHCGPRRLFAAGSLAAAALYALIPLWPAAGFLLACTLLISFVMPLRFISLNTVFLEQLTRLGEGKAGWYRGTHLSGFFLLGPLIAPWIVARAGFAATFWLVALAFCATVLAAPFVFKGYRPRPAGRGFRWREVALQWRLLGAEPALREVVLLEFLAQAVNGYYSFFIIVIAIQGFGLDQARAAQLAAVQGLALIAALFLLGPWAARQGQRAAYLASLGGASLALAGLGLAGSAGWLWPGGIALGLAVGVLEIVNLTRFARLGQVHGRGQMAGLSALAGPGGALAGSLLGGAAGPVLGLQAVFLLFIPALAWFAWRFWRFGVAGEAAPGRPWALLGAGLARAAERAALAALAACLALGLALLARPLLAWAHPALALALGRL